MAVLEGEQDRRITARRSAMIVGLSGYARSGKDTFASFLMSEGFVRIAFADNVKELARRLWPDVMGQYGSAWDLAKQDPVVRSRWQLLGNEVRNVLGEDVWVHAALHGVLPEKTVITDVRYPNEAQRINDLGGAVIRIERPGVGPANGHISEVALDGWSFDYIVANNGTLEDFKREALAVVEKITKVDMVPDIS